MPKPIPGIVREACVETIGEALVAQQRGVERIEFCARLDLDGLTPDFDTTEKLLPQLRIPLHLMIRPRPGNFEHSPAEIRAMEGEIVAAKELGVAGVVFGITDGSDLNYEAIERLALLAKPLKVTVHKAIDTVVDPIASLKRLARIREVDYVLSSGGAASAQEGVKQLAAMQRFCAQKDLSLIACGSITAQNLDRLHSEIGAAYYHGRKIVGEL